MGMQEDLREQLIKQLPSEVVENVDATGVLYYACPTCRRPVAMRNSKCDTWGQNLSWENVLKEAELRGLKRGCIEFDLPVDFTLGNCRKCPLSYIGRSGEDSVYECPLGSRSSCKIRYI